MGLWEHPVYYVAVCFTLESNQVLLLNLFYANVSRALMTEAHVEALLETQSYYWFRNAQLQWVLNMVSVLYYRRYTEEEVGLASWHDNS